MRTGSDQVQLATRAATWTRVLSSSRGYTRPVRFEPSAGLSRQGSRVTSLLKILALWSLPLRSLYPCLCGSLKRAPSFGGREQDAEQQLTRGSKGAGSSGGVHELAAT